MEFRLTSAVRIPMDELEFRALRARGPGGQNVNKVSTAVQLRFDIGTSSLPEDWKARLRALGDRRISHEGAVIITAREHRSSTRNRQAALERLRKLLLRAAHPAKKRKPTRPSRAARQRRLEDKRRRSRTKDLRGRVRD
jgi:ribosome-associated protein